MSVTTDRIDAFDLAPGRVLASKYVVEAALGGGWEGEVYRVVETRTGIRRAAKLFYPHRNLRDRARISSEAQDDHRSDGRKQTGEADPYCCAQQYARQQAPATGLAAGRHQQGQWCPQFRPLRGCPSRSARGAARLGATTPTSP